MADDFYSNQTYDWTVVRGDTINIKMEIIDRNKSPIDMNTFDLVFSIKNFLTDKVIKELSKSRDGQNATPTPNGIYTYDDVISGIAFGTGIDANNKIAIQILPSESAILKEGVYPFDLQMTKSGVYDAIYTQKGRLIVIEDITRNV